MSNISASQQLDANGRTLSGLFGLLATKTLTFDGSTVGDVGTDALFTVTGDVAVCIFGQCTSDLTDSGGTATLEVGISGNTAALIAQTTATGIDAGEVWLDNAAATVETLPSTKLLKRSASIIATTATEAITGGAIVFYCFWYPLSSDGNVVAA